MIGTFGSVNFEVSCNRIFTPFDEEMTAGNKAETKESANGKPQTVKKTPELRTHKFKLKVSEGLGVNAQATVDLWLQMAEDGAAEYINMGGKPLSVNKFLLKSASVGDIRRNGAGKLIEAMLSVDFQEFVAGVATKRRPKKPASYVKGALI